MTDDSQQEQQLISCRVCGATEHLRRCSKCKIAFYCSQTHQQYDWRMHKIECRKYTTNNNTTHNSITATINNTKTSIVSTDTIEQQQHSDTHNHHKQQHNILWPSSKISVKQTSDLGVVVTLPKEELSKAEILNVDADILKTRSNFDRYDMKKYDKNNHDRTQNKDQENGARLYHSLADNSMPISNENILSPNLTPIDMGHEELCKQIINDLNMYGLSVIDDFLGKHKGLEILNEVHHMYNAGVFKNGQLVSNVVAERDLRTIRGDKITWVKGTENGCLNIGYLINQVDNVVISANKMQNNGTLGNYKIRERTKAMVACYPGSGAHYVMHVDNPNKDGRVITAIYYLNLNWDTKRSGGVLRIFPEHADTVADIEPKFDRIIFFWSDRRNPHEVQPAHRTRYAITVWYFDAVERESALNRYRKCKKNNET